MAVDSLEDASYAIAKKLFEEQVEEEYELYRRHSIRAGQTSLKSLEEYAYGRHVLDENNGYQGRVSDEDMCRVRQSFIQRELDEEEFRENSGAEPEAGRADELRRSSYDTLLSLDGGSDVRAERWAIIAPSLIEQLPTLVYTEDQKLSAIYRANGAKYHADSGSNDETEHECMICQSEYEVGDVLRRLPCGHTFRAECVDRWLKQKDQCPTCRRSIETDE